MLLVVLGPVRRAVRDGSTGRWRSRVSAPVAMSQSYTESGVISDTYASRNVEVSYSGLPPGETV